MAAARTYRTRVWRWIERHANGVAVAGVLITVLCMWGFDGRRLGFMGNVFGYPALAIGLTALVAAAASERGVLNKMRVPGAAWMAAASYSLYLTHKMVYRQLHDRFSSWVDGHGVWTALIYVVSIVAVGAALHYTIEDPFLRLREPVRRIWARLRLRYATLPAA